MMNSLTSRERKVVLALAEGLSNKGIGRRLNASEGAVKVHLHNIYNKLGVKNRTALAVLAYTEYAGSCGARTVQKIMTQALANPILYKCEACGAGYPGLPEACPKCGHPYFEELYDDNDEPCPF
jgi:DNA-binding CsgD family transcriptional regulator